jgi:hypothetical protein
MPNTAPPVPGGDPRAAIYNQINSDAAAGRPWSPEAVNKALDGVKP